MRKSAKIISALSVAGLAVVAGSAFTGGGLANNDAEGATDFVGGTVTQTISGANLTVIDYAYTGESNTIVDSVNLTFADDAATYGMNVSAVLDDGIGGTLPETLTCADTGPDALSATVHTITCESTGYSGSTSLAVTVEEA